LESRNTASEVPVQRINRVSIAFDTGVLPYLQGKVDDD